MTKRDLELFKEAFEREELEWSSLEEAERIGEYTLWTEDGACVVGVGIASQTVRLEDGRELTGYCIFEKDEGNCIEWWEDEITLDYDEAVRKAEEYIESREQDTSLEEVVGWILEEGYFKDADADIIREICEEAGGLDERSGLVVLIPRENPWGYQVTTDDAYMFTDYIKLKSSPNPKAAAIDLWAEVKKVREFRREVWDL